MIIEDKTAQLVRRDFGNWINVTTSAFVATGLAWNMANGAGQFYACSIMSLSSDYDGVPLIANDHIMTSMLRSGATSTR
ncbi:hypothetical protein PZA11_007059 [Diplocarpon coronariae]